MVKIKYIGHSTILIENGKKIIIDPYLKGKGREGLSRYNPKAVLSVKEVNPDLILLTHGHGDHFGQTLALLKRTNAKVIASNRIGDFLLKKGIGKERILRIEPSERTEIYGITIIALSSEHKYGLEGFLGDVLGILAYKRYTPCGTNMGYLIAIEGKTIYHSGDTHIVNNVNRPDIAFLAMDGVRTLNTQEAIETIQRIHPKIVVPIHRKWNHLGKRTIRKVKQIIEKEKIPVVFKDISYGEVIEI